MLLQNNAKQDFDFFVDLTNSCFGLKNYRFISRWSWLVALKLRLSEKVVGANTKKLFLIMLADATKTLQKKLLVNIAYMLRKNLQPVCKDHMMMCYACQQEMSNRVNAIRVFFCFTFKRTKIF